MSFIFNYNILIPPKLIKVKLIYQQETYMLVIIFLGEKTQDYWLLHFELAYWIIWTSLKFSIKRIKAKSYVAILNTYQCSASTGT